MRRLPDRHLARNASARRAPGDNGARVTSSYRIFDM